MSTGLGRRAPTPQLASCWPDQPHVPCNTCTRLLLSDGAEGSIGERERERETERQRDKTLPQSFLTLNDIFDVNRFVYVALYLLQTMLRAAGRRLARGRPQSVSESQFGRHVSSDGFLKSFYSSGAEYAIVKDANVTGMAEDVLRMVPDTRPGEIGPGTILLKMLAAPINPADISCIEGRYPLHPNSEEAACHPGFEGVGVVEAIGPGVSRFKPGDLAVPIEAFQGTWRTFAAVNEHHWYRVPGDLSLSTAATLSINPPTALRMLEEFVELQPGDAIVHTGGNSSTGKYILQLAKHRGIRSISVIRDRPVAERRAIEKELQEFGADVVVTAEELGDAVRSWPYGRPKLGMDCVGGETTLEVAKVLAKDAVLVVYGGMSRQPLQIPPGSLIFDNITVKGFWYVGDFARGVSKARSVR